MLLFRVYVEYPRKGFSQGPRWDLSGLPPCIPLRVSQIISAHNSLQDEKVTAEFPAYRAEFSMIGLLQSFHHIVQSSP
jgi:hypothetical protein